MLCHPGPVAAYEKSDYWPSQTRQLPHLSGPRNVLNTQTNAGWGITRTILEHKAVQRGRFVNTAQESSNQTSWTISQKLRLLPIQSAQRAA